MQLVKFAAMAALANALEESHPTVEASTYFPVDGWGIADWTAGLMTGTYMPIQKAWRNNDCRSEWYNVGLRFISFS